jgi:predicted phosphodiesterase
VERDVLNELVTVGSSAIEGVVANRALRHGVGTGALVSTAAGVAIPTLIAWIAGIPVKPSLVGAAIGSLGSGLYDAIALRPTTFLVWGDSHGNQTIHRQVIAKMAKEPGADFAVFLGDAVDGPEDWRRNWDSVVGPLKKRMPIYTIRGNHDDESGYARHAQNPTPQAIRLRVGAVYTIGGPDDVPWVARHASNVDGPIVLCLHRGPAAFVEESAGTAPAVSSWLGPLLRRAAVVLCGDQHVFGVGFLGETSVVTAGIAGPKHYRCLASQPAGWECDGTPRGYLRVTIGDKVHVQLVEVDDVSVA